VTVGKIYMPDGAHLPNVLIPGGAKKWPRFCSGPEDHKPKRWGDERDSPWRHRSRTGV